MQENFRFFKTSKPALAPTQRRAPSVQQTLSPNVIRVEHEADRSPQIVPRLRKSGALSPLLHTPSCCVQEHYIPHTQVLFSDARWCFSSGLWEIKELLHCQRRNLSTNCLLYCIMCTVAVRWHWCDTVRTVWQ
jgi:hypothetical protein